ncbi:MAG: tetratricopeptide repeat protein, partial [Oscillatoriales cyanobacterium]
MSKITIITIVSMFFLQLFAFQIVAQELHTSSKKAAKHYEDSKDYFRSNNLVKAAELLEKAIELDPDFIEAHFALGNAYKLLTKDKPEVLEKYEFHYRKCLELAPNDRKMASIYFEIAQLDFQKGDYKAAKAKFT